MPLKSTVCHAKIPSACRYHHPKPKVVKTTQGNEVDARQAHGFKYETRVREQFELTKTKSAIDPFDARTQSGVLVSIKTKEYGKAVELASWLNHLRVTEDFYMVVGFWQNEKDNIVEELIMKIPATFWKEHFPAEWQEKVKNLFNGISNSHDDDEKWTERREEFQKEYQAYKKENNLLINLNPKRDSKTQRRVQCSIPYADLKNIYEIYKTDEIL